jgi:hypothetical protein
MGLRYAEMEEKRRKDFAGWFRVSGAAHELVRAARIGEEKAKRRLVCHGSRAFPWTPAQSVNKKTISISFLSDISLLTLAYYLNNLNMITSAENVSSNYFPFHFHFPSFSLPDMSMS